MTMTKDEELAQIKALTDAHTGEQHRLINEQQPLVLAQNTIFSKVANLVGFTTAEAALRTPDLSPDQRLDLAELRARSRQITNQLADLTQAREASDVRLGHDVEAVIHEYEYGT